MILEPRIFKEIKKDKKGNTPNINKNELKVLLLSYFNISMSIFGMKDNTISVTE